MPCSTMIPGRRVFAQTPSVKPWKNKALEIGIPLDMSTFRSWRSDDLEALMANARLLRQLTDATTRQAQALVEAMASAASCDLAQGCVGKDGLARDGYGDG